MSGSVFCRTSPTLRYSKTFFNECFFSADTRCAYQQYHPPRRTATSVRWGGKHHYQAEISRSIRPIFRRKFTPNVVVGNDRFTASVADIQGFHSAMKRCGPPHISRDMFTYVRQQITAVFEYFLQFMLSVTQKMAGGLCNIIQCDEFYSMQRLQQHPMAWSHNNN